MSQRTSRACWSVSNVDSTDTRRTNKTTSADFQRLLLRGEKCLMQEKRPKITTCGEPESVMSISEGNRGRVQGPCRSFNSFSDRAMDFFQAEVDDCSGFILPANMLVSEYKPFVQVSTLQARYQSNRQPLLDQCFEEILSPFHEH